MIKLSRRQFTASLAMIPFLGKLIVPKKEEYVYYVDYIRNGPDFDVSKNKDCLALIKLPNKLIPELRNLEKNIKEIEDAIKGMFNDSSKICEYHSLHVSKTILHQKLCKLIDERKEIAGCCFYANLEVDVPNNYKRGDVLPLSTPGVFIYKYPLESSLDWSDGCFFPTITFKDNKQYIS